MKTGTMLVHVLCRAAWLALLLVIGSCGGGGDDGGGDAAAGSLTLSERKAVIARLADRFEQITNAAAETTPAHWESLRQWALVQPEFVDAGTGDQLLWARFSDGRYFLFTDNWHTEGGQRSPALQRAPFADTGALRQAVVPGDVPASADALLLRFTDADFADADPVMQRMARALDDHGWKVAAQRGLTVAALKGARELGFLFVTSHSGNFGPTGDKHFALMTEDQATAANDAAYADDLAEGTLIYHRDRDPSRPDPRYAVTETFVDHYMNFSPESLVILASCHAGSPEAASFRDTLRTKGAGTIIAWDGSITNAAFPIVDLMVDRLAGMNAVDPVTPPNRPFDLDDVWSHLGTKGMLVTEMAEVMVPMRSFGGGFSVLQPIVKELQVVGNDKLVVHGKFGARPATVTVGGRKFSAAPSADGSMLDVDIGPAAEGEVTVTSAGRTSNKRLLVSWRGNLSYRQEKAEPCGTLADQLEVTLHLRGDAHGIRDKVDGPVRDNRYAMIPASDTQATWSSSGTCSDGAGVIEAWSGSGPITFQPYDPRVMVLPGLQDSMTARIDAVERRLQLMTVFAPDPRKTVHHASGDPDTTEPLDLDASLEGFVNDAGNFRDFLPLGTLLPFASGLDIAGGSQRKVSPAEASNSLLVQWGTLRATPAYDDSIGR